MALQDMHTVKVTGLLFITCIYSILTIQLNMQNYEVILMTIMQKLQFMYLYKFIYK